MFQTHTRISDTQESFPQIHVTSQQFTGKNADTYCIKENLTSLMCGKYTVAGKSPCTLLLSKLMEKCTETFAADCIFSSKCRCT